MKKPEKTKSAKKSKNDGNKNSKMTKKANSAKTKNIKTVNPKKGSSINRKLDQILEMQRKLIREDSKIESEEGKIEHLEEETEKDEQKDNVELRHIESEFNQTKKVEEDELTKLQRLEQEIKSDVGEHPLRRITFKDIVKGGVGAFIGLAVHYTFTYGVELSQSFDMTRATFLYILSFFVGLLFIYATGFRKIRDPSILMFLPVRLLVLYVTAIVMSIVVLYLFYPNFGATFDLAYKNIAGVLLAAIVGACTADLIGKG